MWRRSAVMTALLLAGMLAGSGPEAAALPATGRVPAAAVAAQAGSALADFNGDGTADLVVGAPLEGWAGPAGPAPSSSCTARPVARRPAVDGS